MRMSAGLLETVYPYLGLLVTFLVSCVGDTGAKGVAHAPCYNCELFNMMHGDQPAEAPADGNEFDDRQFNNQCQYPCQCPNANAEMMCKPGVSIIKDGCDCCYMCARQQGDLCDYKDKCDEEKGLYCDFTNDGRGKCRAKDGRTCEKDGKTYKDGEEIRDCRSLCTCQDGQYSCTTLCPQEERRPSSVYCKEPRLIAISGKCCKEWTCPVQHDDGFSGQQASSGHVAPAPSQKECRKQSTQWSSCSVTCGMGVSIRVSNDNEDCIPVQQTRLCLVRPCELNDKHLTGKHCKSTWKAKATKIRHGDCQSILEFRPKYCSTCKRRKCCGPGRTKTVSIEFQCSDGRTTLEPFMWIKNCECHKERRCPWK